MADEQVPVASLVGWVRTFADLVSTNKALLTDLDSAIGDADHGTNMSRGLDAVVAKLDAGAPSVAGELFTTVGMTLVSTVGGASGPLFGTFFLRLGTALGAVEEVPATDLAAALRAGLGGVVDRGKAEEGDKTMVDALAPAVAALESAVGDGEPLGAALGAARDAARQGRDATTPMVARKGRASYLGERSADHQDPGATTVALLLDAAVEALA